MKITTAKDTVHTIKQQGLDVRYYLFNDYEIHYNEQAPHTTQTWHHHEKIWETLYIIEGELNAQWREDGEEKSQVVSAGDLIETEYNPHTFSNNSDNITRFLVIKHIPSKQDFSYIFKSDKFLD